MSKLKFYGYDVHAQRLINRMIAVGESPTNSRKTSINKCIKSLKENDLFNNQFDVLVITRGYGIVSTKMNWIKDSSNAIGVNNPTYTTGVGYHNDGVSSYLNTKYIPSTNGILFKQNDASFIIKISSVTNTIGSNGVLDGSGNCYFGQNGFHSLNATTNIGQVSYRQNGYNLINRSGSTKMSVMINNTNVEYNQNSTGIATQELSILYAKIGGAFCTATEINELYAIGKSLTQSKFLIFQNIMNTYFASI